MRRSFKSHLLRHFFIYILLINLTVNGRSVLWARFCCSSVLLKNLSVEKKNVEDILLLNFNTSSICFFLQTNADASISKHVVSSQQYHVITTLIQYYQMETRWSIRQLLLQAFGVLCSFDKTIVSIMLNSILPGELARYVLHFNYIVN